MYGYLRGVSRTRERGGMANLSLKYLKIDIIPNLFIETNTIKGLHVVETGGFLSYSLSRV